MSNYSPKPSSEQFSHIRTSAYNSPIAQKNSAQKATDSQNASRSNRETTHLHPSQDWNQNHPIKMDSTRDDNRNGSKTISIYKAQEDGRSNIPESTPRDRFELNESFKNFKIVHNTSYFSPNNPQTIPPQKVDVSPLGTLESERSHRPQDPLVENILRESSQHIDKINKMLEEHRKKKALKHVNETIETLQTEPNQTSVREYIQTMKEKLTPRGLATNSFGQQTFFSSQQSNRFNIQNDPNEYNPDYTGPPTHKRVFSGEIKDMRQQPQNHFEKTYGTSNGTERELVLHSAREIRTDNIFQMPMNSAPQSTKHFDKGKLPIEDRLMIQEMERQMRLNKLREQKEQNMRNEIRQAPKISKNSKEIIKTSKKYKEEQEHIEKLLQVKALEVKLEHLNKIIAFRQRTRTKRSQSQSNDSLGNERFFQTDHQGYNSRNTQSMKFEEKVITPEGSTVKHRPLSRVQTEKFVYPAKGLSERKSPTNTNPNSTRNILTPSIYSRPNYTSLLRHSPDPSQLSPKHILLQIEPKSSPSPIPQQQVQVIRKSPDQLDEPYDEIQKLEIIENNLLQIKHNNLLKTNSVEVNYPQKSLSNTKSSIVTPKNASNAIKRHQKNNSNPGTNNKVVKIKNPYVKPVVKSIMEIKPTAESLMESVRMRQNKFFEIYDTSLMIKDREELEVPPEEPEQPQPIHHRAISGDLGGEWRSWNEIDVYDRNSIWLSARNNKVDLLNNYKLHNEMKECTFQPHINNTNSVSRLNITSPKGYGSTGPTPLKRLTDRGFQDGPQTIDPLSSPNSIMSNTFRNRSLSKEKKMLQHSYSGLHELKKAYVSNPESLAHGSSQVSPIKRKEDSPRMDMDLIPPMDDYNPPIEDGANNDLIKVSHILTKVKSDNLL